MSNDSAQQDITGDNAVNIASSIERGVREGRFRSGQRLPTVRTLAEVLGVSPATVAAAYHSLRSRGLIVTAGRRGTRISPHLGPIGQRPAPPSQPGAVNLADGNPDPDLLAPMAAALRSIDSSPRLYGLPPHHGGLVQLMIRELNDEGVQADTMAVVSGALEGIDRICAEHLRPGDRVAVEDPGFTGILDLLVARGLTLEPVALDAEGMLPEALDGACRNGARAVIVTPRAQSPTGAALSEQRAAELRRILSTRDDVLVVHDDHARLITDAPLHLLHDPARSRWAYVHSFSKALNPDLRVAVMTGDELTMSRVQRRMLATERWVSHLLQRTTFALLSDTDVREKLVHATETYNRRRQALIDALAARGLAVRSNSGFNVWVPVREETATVQSLAAAGWAVSPGERYRLNTPPGIRITASRLAVEDAARLARALGDALSPSPPLSHA